MKDEQILAPVLGDGKYASSLPFFGGLDIWTANSRIVEKIREAGALFHSETHQHSYMHCWRHRTPIIYRAATQWFAGMDEVPGFKGTKPAETLRASAHAGTPGGSREKSGAGRHRGLAAHRCKGIARPRVRGVRKGEGHARCLVRFGFDARNGAEGLAREAAEVSGGSLPRGLGPASRLVPFLAPRVLHVERPGALRRLAYARLRRRR